MGLSFIIEKRRLMRSILESRYPGYDVDRKITGCLFSDHVAIGHGPGTKYDHSNAYIPGGGSAARGGIR